MKLAPELPDHLGRGKGKEPRTWIDGGALRHVKKKFNIKSMIDVGCGSGGMVELAEELGMQALGVDGDWSFERSIPFELHDYETGSFVPDREFDLCYSCEFVEHVWEKYRQNFFDTFKSAKYLLITHAPPGQGGHHHVNEQPAEYWIEALEADGWEFDKETTDEVRKASTMSLFFMRENGLFFRRK
jgi:SAM-dependent methyltransferase